MSAARFTPAAPSAQRYAQRMPGQGRGAWRFAWRRLSAHWRRGGPAALPTDVALALAAALARWNGAAPEALLEAAESLRSIAARHDPRIAGGTALGLAAAAMQRTLGFTPYETQIRAAWLMLDGVLVEMATGEGKTLAAALAAAAAALSGTPVHVLTANDYLVERDRDAMAPLFDALGLRSAAVIAATPREARVPAYRHDIVYATGREVVFDYLKDHLALHGERDPRALRARVLGGDAQRAPVPVLPGLHQAIVDEADSILLDEASIPFLLAAQGPAPDLAALEAAREVAASLKADDYILQRARRTALLSESGVARVRGHAQPAGPLWPPRHAQELVCAALVAQHLMRRERDYAVTPEGVALIDEITGRIAQGRQWTGPLQAMVELKESLQPSPSTRTAARITYQRFFPRYLRLGGMSGTLREARAELHALYGCPVVRMPLVRPSQARWMGTRCFAEGPARWEAVAHRVRECVAQGRPVLVGTDSVESSRAVSAVLHGHGIAHAVLNAVQDAEEARHIALAGAAGAVTVATNIAGRGTDIRLEPAAREAGGLHVILALANRSRRIDRQVLGRGARHGDPGSAERMLALDDGVLTLWPRGLRAAIASSADAKGQVSTRLTMGLLAGAQRGAEWRERSLRRDLRLADEGLADNFAFAGGTE